MIILIHGNTKNHDYKLLFTPTFLTAWNRDKEAWAIARARDWSEPNITLESYDNNTRYDFKVMFGQEALRAANP